MHIKLDTSPDGFVRADSKAARRFVGPMFGPAATATLAATVELAESYGGFVDLGVDELAARIGINESGLERTLKRLEDFGVVERSGGGDDLVVRQWVDVPTATWREQNYPEELKNEFKLFVDSAIAAQQGIEVTEISPAAISPGEAVSLGR